MNIGLYSFETPNIEKVNRLTKLLNQICKVDNVYIYSENTSKQKLSKRDGLRKLLEDYRNKKINLIAFESIDKLSSDHYTNALILEEFINGDYTFYPINLNVIQTINVDFEEIKHFAQNLIIAEKLFKIDADMRSKKGQEHKQRLEQSKIYTYTKLKK